MQHLGDTLHGRGGGDDERIQIFLDRVPAHVERLVVCVNIYTEGLTFQQVRALVKPLNMRAFIRCV